MLVLAYKGSHIYVSEPLTYLERQVICNEPLRYLCLKQGTTVGTLPLSCSDYCNRASGERSDAIQRADR
jgi:hypothetical protein